VTLQFDEIATDSRAIATELSACSSVRRGRASRAACSSTWSGPAEQVSLGHPAEHDEVLAKAAA
jgi:hypothetical protein